MNSGGYVFFSSLKMLKNRGAYSRAEHKFLTSNEQGKQSNEGSSK